MLPTLISLFPCIPPIACATRQDKEICYVTNPVLSVSFYAISPAPTSPISPDSNSEADVDDAYNACTAWVRNSISSLSEYSIGSYLGDADFRVRRNTRFWSSLAGKRLGEVRRRWDPEGGICGFLGGDIL